MKTRIPLWLLPVCLAACSPTAATAENATLAPPVTPAQASSRVPLAAAEEPTRAPEMMVVPVALETSVQAHVQVSLAAAEAEGRQLVVYIGATWCEPCRRFHDAVKAGQLNDALAGVRFLEFDHDAHQEGLKVSGYLRRFVPLFAIPNPDGTASNRLHEGAIKGPGAVDFIVPRLKALLDDRSAAQPAL